MKTLTTAFTLALSLALAASAAQLGPPVPPPPPRNAVALTPEQRSALLAALQVGPDSDLTVTVTDEFESDEGELVTTERATGEGAGLRASGDKLATDFNGSAPTAGLGAGRAGASGGSSDSEAEVTSVVARAARSGPLLWVGLLIVAAGGGLLYLRLKRAAVTAFALGGALVAAGLFPVAAAWIIGAGVLAAAGVYALAEWQKSRGDSQLSDALSSSVRYKEALRAVAAGVSSLPDQLREQVKDSVRQHADDADKEVIKQVRREDDLK